MTEPEIILHHYDSSPYAERARKALGLKGLAWRSVIVPNVMPKPKLMPLTGGYRRVPVMQIGADIYCDTAMILRELERRFPEPSLFPGGRLGMPFGLAKWTDGEFFRASACLVFPAIADKLTPEWIADRSKLRGEPFDIAAMRAAAPAMRDEWRAFAGWIEDHLSDGKAWIMGDRPGAVDIHAYMIVWWVRTRAPAVGPELLKEFRYIPRWAANMDAIGHGQRREMSDDEALAVARGAEPLADRAEDADDPQGRKPGDRVTVTPIDNARVPVRGEIVSLSRQHVSLRRHDDEVGTVIVHFPRAGFAVAPA